LEKEGPDGVYPHISGYHIAAFDTIYFYSMKTVRLYVLNHEGKRNRAINYRFNMEKLDDLDLDDLLKKTIPPSIRVDVRRPIYTKGNKVFLCGEITEEFGKVDSINHLIVTIIDTEKNDDVELAVGYPSSYRNGNWGENYYRETAWCYNDVNGLFYINFPNDHYIYQTDLKNVKKIYAGSMYADDIKSLDYPAAIPVPRLKRIEHYLSQYYYSSIIYDKYRNIYYRMVQHPWIDFNPDIRPWQKPVSVVVYDAEFNFMCEKLLEKEYNLSCNRFIVSKDGLLLYKKLDNDDKLVFTVFNIVKK
jgi:hypothetical protein